MTAAICSVIGAIWGLGEVSVERDGECGSPRRAEAELIRHLEQIGGNRPKTAGGRFRLVLGRAPDGEPAPRQFESHAKKVGNAVYMWGDDSGAYPGTLYAVYGFLRDRLGVDWAYPGVDGVVYERRKEIELPDRFHDVFSPAYEIGRFRTIWIGHFAEFSDKIPEGLRWTKEASRQRVDDIVAWHERHRVFSKSAVEYGHAFTGWQDRFLTTHPEYLSLRDDGTRIGLKWQNKTTVKLCISNPAVVDQIIADWCAAGTNRYLNICENDGWNYCECPSCKALDTDPPGEDFNHNKTDRYLWFWNRVSEKAKTIRPDVKCITYIYSSYRFPPRRERIENPDNMLFGIVPTFADDIEKFIGDWSKAGLKRFFLRPNYHCAFTVLPRGVEKRIYDIYRFCLSNGLEGVDFDADFGRYPLRPENYVTCRMIADPSGRFEDFMRDFCRAYGEAAPEFLEYYARIRARYEAHLAETARDALAANFLDDTQMARFQLRTHTEDALLEDQTIIRRASMKTIASPEARKRVLDMLVVTEHYILTYRFMMAFANKDKNPGAFRSAAKKLLDFRLSNQGVLRDIYGMNMAGNWKGLENRIWPCTGLLCK